MNEQEFRHGPIKPPVGEGSKSLMVIYRQISITIEDVGKLPASREASMVMTKLDEARLWLSELAIRTPP